MAKRGSKKKTAPSGSAKPAKKAPKRAAAVPKRGAKPGKGVIDPLPGGDPFDL